MGKFHTHVHRVERVRVWDRRIHTHVPNPCAINILQKWVAFTACLPQTGGLYWALFLFSPSCCSPRLVPPLVLVTNANATQCIIQTWSTWQCLIKCNKLIKTRGKKKQQIRRASNTMHNMNSRDDPLVRGILLKSTTFWTQYSVLSPFLACYYMWNFSNHWRLPKLENLHGNQCKHNPMHDTACGTRHTTTFERVLAKRVSCTSIDVCTLH
jgi:hypothetical protein